jgi:hypothetical protein
LQAVVQGSEGSYYETRVYFEPADSAQLAFASSECTCPVGFDCKYRQLTDVVSGEHRALAFSEFTVFLPMFASGSTPPA